MKWRTIIGFIPALAILSVTAQPVRQATASEARIRIVKAARQAYQSTLQLQLDLQKAVDHDDIYWYANDLKPRAQQIWSDYSAQTDSATGIAKTYFAACGTAQAALLSEIHYIFERPSDHYRDYWKERYRQDLKDCKDALDHPDANPWDGHPQLGE